MVTLSEVSPTERVELTDVPDDETRVRLLRLGFLDGSVECVRTIRNGPVVLGRGETRVALGRPVAREIGIERVATGDTRS
jgi:ferrous iron transport protein A